MLRLEEEQAWAGFLSASPMFAGEGVACWHPGPDPPAFELQSPQHLRQSSTQRGYNLAECPQARLTGSPLQVGDVDLMDA
jgi:hypothetical protein